MAENTDMNSQVTDAVSQANLLVGGEAPAHATGHSYQSMAHSTGLSFQNTVATQQQNIVQSNAEAVLLTQHLLALSIAESGAMAASVGDGFQGAFRSSPNRRARRPGRRFASRP